MNAAVIGSGGRVLYITGLGRNIDEAAANSYGVDRVGFQGMQYRTDIGYQARTSN